MILYEFEGKDLFSKAGITVPESQLVDAIASLQNDTVNIPFPVVLKAQVLSGKRADAGGIMMVNAQEELKPALEKMLGMTVNNEKVEQVLVESKANIEREFYVSLTYDTDVRGPVLSISEEGGTGIEQREIKKYQLDLLNTAWILDQVQNDNIGIDANFIEKMIDVFLKNDCLLLEINPLVLTKEGEWMALDAKVNLDDTALGRHKEEWNYSPRSAPGHTLKQREIDAKKIDEGDYRGVAGSAFFDLDGDIAVMSSGGGASLTAMDALIKIGGKPANFTEYSGNPPKEKVMKLTKVVLDKPGLHGLWVVGGVANFTDIYETLSGIVETLKELKAEGVKLDFPIVIRRGGPRDQEAFAMIKEIKDFDFHLYGQDTSISQSAEIMAKLAKEYAGRSSH